MKSVSVVFYESPSEGGKRVRRIAKTDVSAETLIGALDFVRGSISKSSEEMVEKIVRITIDIKGNNATWE